jgi:hypothetical protein
MTSASDHIVLRMEFVGIPGESAVLNGMTAVQQNDWNRR